MDLLAEQGIPRDELGMAAEGIAHQAKSGAEELTKHGLVQIPGSWGPAGNSGDHFHRPLTVSEIDGKGVKVPTGSGRDIQEHSSLTPSPP